MTLSRPDEGSTFTISLPAADAAKIKETAGDDLKETKDILKCLKVLIVEDNELNLHTTIMQLQKFGFLFDAVADGRQAEEKSKKNKYDLILMDIDLPGISGIEAAERIKQNSPHQLIFALTSYTREALQKSADQGLFDLHFHKPLQPEPFLKQVRGFSPELKRVLAERQKDRQKLKNRKILIADDSEDFHILAAKLLQEYEPSIERAATGKEALEKTSSKDETVYDLILLDIHPGDMSGYDVLIKIRQNSVLKSIPVLATTAGDSPEDIQAIMKSDFQGYLKKPVSKQSFAVFLAGFL